MPLDWLSYAVIPPTFAQIAFRASYPNCARWSRRYGTVGSWTAAAILCRNARAIDKQEKAIARGVSKGEWLQAALDALARGNVSEITIGFLARSLGISKSGFYWHFRNRDDLLDQLLEYWNHEVTEVVTKNAELLTMEPMDRLVKAAEIIVDNNLVRFEIGIRQWAMNDKRAARVVRLVNRRRLDFARLAFGEIGFPDDEAEVRAMLFVCYHTWEAPMFPEISRKRRRELIGKRIALLTRI
jgi:AcrR family transcriptional regulator